MIDREEEVPSRSGKRVIGISQRARKNARARSSSLLAAIAVLIRSLVFVFY